MICFFFEKCIDNWPTEKTSIDHARFDEEQILVKKFAKLEPDLKLNHLINEPISILLPIEEIILEAVDKNSKNNFSKLFIQRRWSDGVYFCQLSLRMNEFNYQIESQESSSLSSDVLFKLGQLHDAEKLVTI
jgi:hypothetical protein